MLLVLNVDFFFFVRELNCSCPGLNFSLKFCVLFSVFVVIFRFTFHMCYLSHSDAYLVVYLLFYISAFDMQVKITSLCMHNSELTGFHRYLCKFSLHCFLFYVVSCTFLFSVLLFFSLLARYLGLSDPTILCTFISVPALKFKQQEVRKKNSL